MTVNDLITALRNKESRDNRELLDEAAATIEALWRDMGELRYAYDDCFICKHFLPEDNPDCVDCDWDCLDCRIKDCKCHNCHDKNWEWRGVQ